jgi:hypothetical protein
MEKILVRRAKKRRAFCPAIAFQSSFEEVTALLFSTAFRFSFWLYDHFDRK